MIYKQNTTDRRKMFAEARNLGFVDVYFDKATKGSPSVCEMRAQQGTRFLRIQFWGNGKHRVSHGLIGEYGDFSDIKINSTPTDFHDLMSMCRAIAFEWQRKPPTDFVCFTHHVIATKAPCVKCGQMKEAHR